MNAFTDYSDINFVTSFEKVYKWTLGNAKILIFYI